ncbi:MAG: tripartite tricarboxylate transporter substrate binding protein [Betaproteobacteria bacterium]|nr:tripartite tricarboxylate transporter substrate binding protein [Betaproteobacteria bacterium]
MSALNTSGLSVSTASIDIRRMNDSNGGVFMKSIAQLRVVIAGLLLIQTFGISAQTWPTKPIKLITSAAPGGIVDIYARRHQPHLQAELGQPIVVDNKPGASGAIAGDAAAKSEADGHTLFMGSQNELGLIGQLGVPVRYDPVKDFSVVGLTIAGYPILMVNSQLGVKSVPELVAYMKAKNAPLDCGGSGTATVGHFVCAAFSVRTGTKLQYVPYKSNVPAMTDAASGQIQLVGAFYSEGTPSSVVANLFLWVYLAPLDCHFFPTYHHGRARSERSGIAKLHGLCYCPQEHPWPHNENLMPLF